MKGEVIARNLYVAEQSRPEGGVTLQIADMNGNVFFKRWRGGGVGSVSLGY